MVKKIISAYSCLGKSTLAQKAKEEGKYNIVDLDSSDFSWVDRKEYTPSGEEVFFKERNPNFVEEYFNAIKKLHDDESVDHILISTHGDIRRKLTEKGLEFTTVTPSLDSKEVILERMKKRGDSENFINMMSDHYEKTLEDIKDSTPKKQGRYVSGLVEFYELNLVGKDGGDNGLFLTSNVHEVAEKTLSDRDFLIYEFAFDTEKKLDVKRTLVENLLNSEFFGERPEKIENYLNDYIEDVVQDTGRWSIYGYRIYEHPTDPERFLREDYDDAATEMQENGESHFSEVRRVVELKEVVSYV